MKLKKSKTLRNLLFASLGFCCALTLFSIPTNDIPVKASTNNFSVSSTDIVVKAYNSNENEITTDPQSVNIDENSYNYYSIPWKNISYFEITLPNTDFISEGVSVYNYQYQVIWTPESVTDGALDIEATDRVEMKDILKTVSSTKTGIKTSIRFYVDSLDNTATINSFSGNSTFTGTDYESNGGWGIYQFSFICNSVTKSSYIYEITPTKISDITADLKIQSEIIRSNYSINNGYICTIKTPDYKYVNRNNIIWKVTGEGSDGKKYVLLHEDIPSGDNTTQSIVKDNSYNRSGNSFKFDFDIVGTWKISCEISNPENVSEIKKSNELTVSTTPTLSTSLIVWIVVGGIALLGIILTVIIVVSKRKERIW